MNSCSGETADRNFWALQIGEIERARVGLHFDASKPKEMAMDRKLLTCAGFSEERNLGRESDLTR